MLLAGLLVTLAQAPVTPVGAGDRPHRGACVAVEVTSAQDPTVSAQLPTFSAARIIDLQLTAVVRTAPGRGVLRFKVFTPGGFLYQSLAAPFVVPPRDGQGVLLRTQVVDGFPQGVREQEAQPAESRNTSRYRVSASLPVAGTLITTSGLYGRWTVEPWFEDAARPCAHSKAFVIGQ
jgi:hypothetical protein